MSDALQLSLCQMQGHLFQMTAIKGYDSVAFAKTFMTSNVAKDLDKPFHFAQWAGEAYLLERLEEENGAALRAGEVLNAEVLYWCGYLYRAWHYYTGEDSKAVYRQAPLPLLNTLYLAYHTMSVEMAIDRLKERVKNNVHSKETIYAK